MAKGIPSNGLPNPSWFKKGHKSPNGFKKGGFIPKRSKESYARGTAKMVATRKAQGSYVWSAESKRKASIAHTGTKKPWARDNIINLMLTGKIKKPVYKTEAAMMRILDYWGYKYEYQPYIEGVICDFYIPSKNLIVFVDGEHWHNYPFGTEKDKEQEKKLTEAGYVVRRYWGRPTEHGAVRTGVKYFLDSLLPVEMQPVQPRGKVI